MPRNPLAYLLLSFALFACAPGGNPSLSPQHTNLPDVTASDSLVVDSDSLLGATELMRRTYAFVRASADATTSVAAEADALADEAELMVLLGEDDEAMALWTEAISLLEPTPANTKGAPILNPRERSTRQSQ